MGMYPEEEALERSVAFANAATEHAPGSAAFRNLIAASAAHTSLAKELRLGRSKTRTYTGIGVNRDVRVVVIGPGSDGMVASIFSTAENLDADTLRNVVTELSSMVADVPDADQSGPTEGETNTAQYQEEDGTTVG